MYWVELVLQGKLLPYVKALWEAGTEDPFLCGKSHVGVPPSGSGTMGTEDLYNPLNTTTGRAKSKKVPLSIKLGS